MKALNVIMKIRSFLRWLIFLSLAILFSLGLAQSFISIMMDNETLNYNELYATVTLIPLSITASALVVIIFIILLNSRRNKKILKSLDCIDDRGTPDGGL